MAPPKNDEVFRIHLSSDSYEAVVTAAERLAEKAMESEPDFEVDDGTYPERCWQAEYEVSQQQLQQAHVQSEALAEELTFTREELIDALAEVERWSQLAANALSELARTAHIFAGNASSTLQDYLRQYRGQEEQMRS